MHEKNEGVTEEDEAGKEKRVFWVDKRESRKSWVLDVV